MTRRSILWREFIQLYYVSVMILFAFNMMYTLQQHVVHDHAVFVHLLKGILFMLNVIVASLVIPFFLYFPKHKIIGYIMISLKFIALLYLLRGIEVLAIHVGLLDGELIPLKRFSLKGLFVQTMVIVDIGKGNIYPFMLTTDFSRGIFHFLFWFTNATSVFLIYKYAKKSTKYATFSPIKFQNILLLGLAMFVISVAPIPQRMDADIIIDFIDFEKSAFYQYELFPFFNRFSGVLFLIVWGFLPMGVIIRYLFGKLMDLVARSKRKVE